MAVAGGVAADAGRAGLHPVPPEGAGVPPQVALRGPPYRDRPAGARLAAVAPRLREHGVPFFLRSVGAGLGPLLRLRLQTKKTISTSGRRPLIGKRQTNKNAALV